MQAKELMTTDVVAVEPHAPVAEIARTLLDHAISAVPVIDDSGALVGMVSEGDLIGRDDAERDARHDWWLELMADNETPNEDRVASLSDRPESAKDVMTAPVVTVNEDTDAREVARLLTAYRIKRVPVVRDGRVVGIVSRGDLLRAVTVPPPAAKEAPHPPGMLSRAIAGIDRRFHPTERPATAPDQSRPAEALGEAKVTAADFRGLVADHEREEVQHHEKDRLEAARQRKAMVQSLVDEHIEDEKWRELLHRAREAAESGQKEMLLLRFPSQLCSDGGRAINAPEPDWPTTLRGEAAELYLRWEHDLKPHGFHLIAQVLDFPGGVPGDIGLFLVWGG
jgi:CBS domain-containing protein